MSNKKLFLSTSLAMALSLGVSEAAATLNDAVDYTTDVMVASKKLALSKFMPELDKILAKIDDPNVSDDVLSALRAAIEDELGGMTIEAALAKALSEEGETGDHYKNTLELINTTWKSLTKEGTTAEQLQGFTKAIKEASNSALVKGDGGSGKVELSATTIDWTDLTEEGEPDRTVTISGTADLTTMVAKEVHKNVSVIKIEGVDAAKALVVSGDSVLNLSSAADNLHIEFAFADGESFPDKAAAQDLIKALAAIAGNVDREIWLDDGVVNALPDALTVNMSTLADDKRTFVIDNDAITERADIDSLYITLNGAQIMVRPNAAGEVDLAKVSSVFTVKGFTPGTNDGWVKAENSKELKTIVVDSVADNTSLMSTDAEPTPTAANYVDQEDGVNTNVETIIVNPDPYSVANLAVWHNAFTDHNLVVKADGYTTSLVIADPSTVPSNASDYTTDAASVTALALTQPDASTPVDLTRDWSGVFANATTVKAAASTEAVLVTEAQVRSKSFAENLLTAESGEYNVTTINVQNANGFIVQDPTTQFWIAKTLILDEPPTQLIPLDLSAVTGSIDSLSIVLPSIDPSSFTVTDNTAVGNIIKLPIGSKDDIVTIINSDDDNQALTLKSDGTSWGVPSGSSS